MKNHQPKKRLIACLAFLVVASSSTGSHGALMMGQELGYEYLYPDAASVFFTYPVTVGPGVEVPGLWSLNRNATIDFSDTNILVDFYQSETIVSADFSGFHVWDVNGTIPDFTAVSVDSATNMLGFGPSNVTFDSNNIWVNLQDLSFTTDTIVSLNVNENVSAIHEPGSVLGLALVLGSGAFIRARRRDR